MDSNDITGTAPSSQIPIPTHIDGSRGVNSAGHGIASSGLGGMTYPASQTMAVSGPQKKILLRQHHLTQVAHTMSERETGLWEACVLRCCLQTAPVGGLPLSRLLEVLDHITFLQGVTSNDNHSSHSNNHNNNYSSNSSNSNNHNDHHIKSSSRSAQERSKKLDIARRRLCSDVESLKMTIHRLQSQGEVEVVLVNSTVQNDVILSVDGVTTTSAGSSGSSSNSGNKGGSVEICVRLVGDVLPITDLSNDEMNDSNSARAREEGLMCGRLGKLKHAMKYRTNERGLTEDEIATTDDVMEVVDGGVA